MEDGFEESASESLLVSMDTITSFMPEDFSWEDSRSSEEENMRRLRNNQNLWVSVGMTRFSGQHAPLNHIASIPIIPALFQNETDSSLPCPWMWDTSRPSFRRRITAPNWKSKASLRGEMNKIAFQQQWTNGQVSTNEDILKKMKSRFFRHTLSCADSTEGKGHKLSLLSHLIKVDGTISDLQLIIPLIYRNNQGALNPSAALT